MNSSPTPRTSRLVQASALCATALFIVAGCSKASDTTATGSSAPASVSTTAAAGSGASTSSSAATPGSASGSSAASGAAAVATASTSLGTILVDAKGMTLYVFDKDTGTTSACTAACAKAWPPAATTGSPTAGTGIDQSKIATTKRDDGTTQITYAGHPLYTYAGDAKAGDVTGQGSGGIWWVVGPDGTKIATKA